MHFSPSSMNSVLLFDERSQTIGKEDCSFIFLFIFVLDRDVYLFYYSPKEKKIKWRTSDDPQYQFLPDWFTKEFS